MIQAEWRITRQTPEGEPLPLMDYTDLEQALIHLDRARQLNAPTVLQQYNQFTGQWQETDR